MSPAAHLLRALASSVALACGIAMAAAQGIPLHSEPFDYSGWSEGSDPMSGPWALVSGTSPPARTAEGGRFSLDNVVISKPLALTLSEDFDLVAEVLHTGWTRGLWVGLFNDAGTQGYAFLWDSANDWQHGGGGAVSIRKFDVGAPSFLQFNTHGDILGSSVTSGHPALTAPFARIRLTWNKQSATLALYVDGQLKSTRTAEPAFSSFSRLYVGGGQGTLFDSITVSGSVPRRGAKYPWAYYEAEQAARHADAVLQTGTALGATGLEAAYEARGKQCVVLDAPGEYVEWTQVRAANRATFRYSVPAGATDSLSLHVNGGATPVATLPLTSARMREAKPVADMPGGLCRFFDDVCVTVDIPANATVRLQKNTASSNPCLIDFMELETAPPPLAPPDSTWVVAGPGGTADDRQVLVNAINTANAGAKKLWLPAGTYTLNSQINIPSGLHVSGAGIWHTTVIKNFEGQAARLFRMVGVGNTVENFKAVDTLTTLSNNGSNAIFFLGDASTGYARTCTIRNIWSEYATLASAYGVGGLTVSGCRVRNGYKDAIHVATSAHDVVVEDCTFRNAGDDCIAFVAYASPNLKNNVARYNTVELCYWGRGISVIGGDGHTIENNVVRDCSIAGILVAIQTWEGSVPPFCKNFVVQNNTVLRCGSQRNGAYGASVAIYGGGGSSLPMSGLMQNNEILAPPFHGAQLTGYLGDTIGPNVVEFRFNRIDPPAAGGTWKRKQVAFEASSNCIHTPNTDSVPIPPPAPLAPTAGAAAGGIGVGWIDVAIEETGVRVERRAGAETGFTPIATLAANESRYLDGAVSAGVPCYYRVIAFNAAGESPPSPVVFALLPTPLQAWRMANGLPFDGSGSGDDQADLSGNGMPNLLKYALGLPALSQSVEKLPTARLAGNRLTLTFQRDPALVDIHYVVEATSDLPGTWSPIARSEAGAPTAALNAAVTVQESGDPLRTVTVQDGSDLGSSSRRFLRLRILRP